MSEGGSAMGNFYVNQTVKCADPARLAEFLADYQAFLSPVRDGTVVVYERRCDLQEIGWGQSFSDDLSIVAGGPVLNMLNHDDDVLYYTLHRDGAMIGEYNSTPRFFDETDSPFPSGGDAALLCKTFASGNVAAIKPILHMQGEKYLFAINRHKELVAALGMPAHSVGYGWIYLSRGECPKSLDRADLLEFKGSAAYKDFVFPY
jgi:hypothetical protein